MCGLWRNVEHQLGEESVAPAIEEFPARLKLVHVGIHRDGAGAVLDHSGGPEAARYVLAVKFDGNRVTGLSIES